MTNNQSPTFVSVGYNCRPACHIRRRGEHVAFPLDVVRTLDLNKVQQLVARDWSGFLDRANYEKVTEGHWRNVEYDINLWHDSVDQWDLFVHRYTQRIDAFRKAVDGHVVFVREDAGLADFRRFLDLFPRSRGILVNYGPLFRLVSADEQIRQWHVHKTVADAGDHWREDSWAWDIIFESGEW